MNLQLLDESIAHWETLAAEQAGMADYEESRGRYGGVYRTRARTYGRAAEALRLEKAVGVPHCSCCLKPRKVGLHS